MTFFRYSIPASSFPRYRYTKKVGKDIAKRFNDLKCKISLEDAPQVKEWFDDEKEDVSIFLCKSSLKEEQFSSIRSFCCGHAEVHEIFIPESIELFFKSQHFSSNSFVVTSKSDILANTGLQENCPAQIILVAENETYDTFNKRKDTRVGSVEKVRQEISTHLERCALTGLKCVCEFLEDLLNTDDSNNRHAEITKQWGKTMTEDQATCKNNNGLVEKCKENKDIKETIERLIDEIVGTFNRSLLPKNEHPELKSMQKRINEKLLKDLRKLSPLIKSCGYRFSTFQVYVDGDPVSDILLDKIEKTLRMHEITSFQIVPSDIMLFTKVSTGSKISPIKADNGYGTLGGFAKTSSEESERLWVLMSRHVAMHSTDRNVYIKDDKGPIVAKVMKQINEDETGKQYLDIAAACVEKELENRCDTKYITEEGVKVQGRLFEYDADKLKGLPVHIRGASTPLGLGTITVPKREAVQDDGLDENYIVVEDRDTDENVKFCTKGDSGAIVCAESQDNFGEEVHLISMVVGENLKKKGSYTTLRLDKGLTEIDRLTEKEFKLC